MSNLYWHSSWNIVLTQTEIREIIPNRTVRSRTKNEVLIVRTLLLVVSRHFAWSRRFEKRDTIAPVLVFHSAPKTRLDFFSSNFNWDSTKVKSDYVDSMKVKSGYVDSMKVTWSPWFDSLLPLVFLFWSKNCWRYSLLATHFRKFKPAADKLILLQRKIF